MIRLVDPQARFTVTGVSGAGLLGPVVRLAERSGDGSRLISTELPERVIAVSFSLKTGHSISVDTMSILDDAERALSGIFAKPGLHELRFPHQNGYFLATAGEVQVTGRWGHYLKGVIEFLCPSPFLYGEQRTIETSGGTVTVGSNYIVEPVILWRTSNTHGAPHIEVDGQRLTIDTQVGGGQQIRIDTSRMETRIGGVLNVEHIRGTYPRIFDGSTITTSPGGTLSIQYQERWV